MSSCNHPCQNPRGNSGRREQYSREMMQHERTSMENRGMTNYSLAMAYVPWQRWGNLYQPDEGFHNGTIFKDLNLPFTGRRMC